MPGSMERCPEDCFGTRSATLRHAAPGGRDEQHPHADQHCRRGWGYRQRGQLPARGLHGLDGRSRALLPGFL